MQSQTTRPKEILIFAINVEWFVVSARTLNIQILFAHNKDLLEKESYNSQEKKRSITIFITYL